MSDRREPDRVLRSGGYYLQVVTPAEAGVQVLDLTEFRLSPE